MNFCLFKKYALLLLFYINRKYLFIIIAILLVSDTFNFWVLIPSSSSRKRSSLQTNSFTLHKLFYLFIWYIMYFLSIYRLDSALIIELVSKVKNCRTSFVLRCVTTTKTWTLKLIRQILFLIFCWSNWKFYDWNNIIFIYKIYLNKITK